MKNTTITRRHVLAIAAVSAVGGLAGCLNQVAGRTTNTNASPAAMFGGIRDDQLIPVEPSDTIRFSPTLRVEEQFLSGEIELEAWMTNAKVAPANDYNSVRSNKRRSAFGPVPDDGTDEDDRPPWDPNRDHCHWKPHLLRRNQTPSPRSRRPVHPGCSSH